MHIIALGKMANLQAYWKAKKKKMYLFMISRYLI